MAKNAILYNEAESRGGTGVGVEMGLATRKYMGPTEVGAAPRQTKNSPKSHQCSFIRAHGAELGAVL